MLRVLKMLWKSLGEYYYDIVSLTLINLLWLLTGVAPFFIFLGLAQTTGFTPLLALALLSLVVAPPSFGALMYTTQQFNHGESVDRHTFFTGFRRFFRLSWIIASTDLVLGGLLVANCLFYLTQSSSAFKLFGLIWVYGLLFWLAMQCYLWPLMVEQEKKKLLLFYRNSALLVLDNLGFSISLTVIMVLFIGLSLLLGLPALILVGPVSGLIVHKALTAHLEKYGQQPSDAATGEADSLASSDLRESTTQRSDESSTTASAGR